ncbi:hypothetical protein OHU11_30000 [Streptomyces sp. NBC_00257]|nr:MULTISPECIES: hypothetical protein [unclassified Streptomyces]MCX5431885.1 hypothetical protein [Streptomyces sp. NBC_00062]
MTTAPQQPSEKQLVAAGTIRPTRDGSRTITTTATPAGVSGRITPAGGAR